MLLPTSRRSANGPPHEVLRNPILEIYRRRDWTTAGQFAGRFSMHRRGLANRHLRPLLNTGLLERRYPEKPNTPKQAYRTARKGPAKDN